MSIKFDPAAMLKKIAPKKKVERLLSSRVSLKRTALSFLNDVDFINKTRIADVALKTIKAYRERIAADREQRAEIVDDPKQLIQRVQNEVVLQVHDHIKVRYGGETARWLPSDAEEPRPEHQLNYGKLYTIGEGINGVEPGDEYGCRCGVEIMVDENKLDL